MEQINGSDAPPLPIWESFLIKDHDGDFPSGPYSRMISKLYGTGGESSETINSYRIENQQSLMGSTSGQSLLPILGSGQNNSPNRLLSVNIQARQDDVAANTSGSQFLFSPNQKIHEDQLLYGENQDGPTKSGQSKELMFSSFGFSGAQLPNFEKQDEPTRIYQSKDHMFSRFGSAGVQLPYGENQGEPANLVPLDDQSKAHDEKLKMDGVPPGVVFMCNRKTWQTCFQFGLFGLPGSQTNLVSRIVPGTKLFLFVVDLRVLHGIFEATSNGGFNLDVNAFGGLFPSQVRFRICKECKPLAEKDFREAIKDNYFAHNKFSNELTSQQVSSLIQLFCPEGFVDEKTQNHQGLFLRHLNAGSSRGHSALDLLETQSEKSMDISPQNSPTMGHGKDIYGKERDYLTNLGVANRHYNVNGSDKYLQNSPYGSNIQPSVSSIQSNVHNEWSVEGNFHHNEKRHSSLHTSYGPSSLQSAEEEILSSRFNDDAQIGKFQARDSFEASDQYVLRSRSWFPETITGDTIEQNRILQPNSVERNVYDEIRAISGQERAEYLSRVYQCYEQEVEQLRQQEDREFCASRGVLQGQIDGSSLLTRKRASEDNLDNTSNSYPLKKPNYYRESHKDRVPDNGNCVQNASQMENGIDNIYPMQVFPNTHRMSLPNSQEMERGLDSLPTESGFQHFSGPVRGSSTFSSIY